MVQLIVNSLQWTVGYALRSGRIVCDGEIRELEEFPMTVLCTLFFALYDRRIKLKRDNNLYNLIISTLFVTINIVLANIALNLKLPLFLDTLGTMLGVRFFGLKYGLLIAGAGAFVNSFTDPYAIPYLPTYIATAIMISVVYNNKKLKKLPLLLKALLVTLPSATIGGIITAYIFGGITSSGTSIILAALTKTGLSLVQSSMIVQIVFEFIDKIAMMFLMETSMKYIPEEIINR